MILFNDTGVDWDTILGKIALMLTATGLLLALTATSVLCLIKFSRVRALLLGVSTVAVSVLLLAAPDARQGIQFSLGVLAAIAGGG